MLYGYARVSTEDQDAEIQRFALKGAGCDARNIFTDRGLSGKFVSRPALEHCLAKLERGDILAVWKLDRFGRDTHDLLGKVKILHEKGVQFRSLTERIIDTTAPQGELIFQIFAAFAQFERSLLLERTTAGRKMAKAQGRKFGPKFKMTADKKMTALRLLASGDSCAKAAGIVGVSRSTLYRELGKLPPSLLNKKRRQVPVQAFGPPPELKIDHEAFARIEEEVFKQQRLELALIESDNPEIIAVLEDGLERKQADVVNDWIENNAVWSYHLSNLVGGKGTAEERRQAILRLIQDDVSPEENVNALRSALPDASKVELLESGDALIMTDLREFVDPALRPFLKPR